MTTWIDACAIDDIDEDDVLPFATGGRDYAIFKNEDGEVFAGDGHCTHERELLCNGLVMDGVIECPKHNGRFDIRTGKALGAPALVDLRTYPVRTEAGRILIDIDG